MVPRFYTTNAHLLRDWRSGSHCSRDVLEIWLSFTNNSRDPISRANTASCEIAEHPSTPHPLQWPWFDANPAILPLTVLFQPPYPLQLSSPLLFSNTTRNRTRDLDVKLATKFHLNGYWLEIQYFQEELGRAGWDGWGRSDERSYVVEGFIEGEFYVQKLYPSLHWDFITSRYTYIVRFWS